MHKNLRDLKITPDTCTEKCTKIAQGMKHYVISSSEKMVLAESRHLRIKIKKHILQRLFPNRRHLYPQEFSLYLSPFSADLLKQHYHINHLDIHLCGLKSYYLQNYCDTAFGITMLPLMIYSKEK